MLLLSRAYNGYPAGTVAQFDSPTEAALVEQGYGVVSTAVPTAGAQNITSGQKVGAGAIAAGAASVTITHPDCVVQSIVNAFVAQAAGDATAPAILRTVPALGSFQVFAAANATAITRFTWQLVNVPGSVRS